MKKPSETLKNKNKKTHTQAIYYTQLKKRWIDLYITISFSVITISLYSLYVYI